MKAFWGTSEEKASQGKSLVSDKSFQTLGKSGPTALPHLLIQRCNLRSKHSMISWYDFANMEYSSLSSKKSRALPVMDFREEGRGSRKNTEMEAFAQE